MYGTQNRDTGAPLTGGNRTEYDTSDYEAEFDPTQMIGCHSGRFGVLNVAGQPGFAYCWANNNPRDLYNERLRGGQVVQAEDPEFAALKFQIGGAGQIDSAVLFQDCVLVRYPIEAKRQERAEIEQLNLKQVRGAEAQFAEGASAAERAATRRGPSRFRTDDHRVEYYSGGDVVGEWTPNDGIIPRR